MKTKQLFLAIGFCIANIISINAQTANTATTSYGLSAGIPTVSSNESAFFGFEAGKSVLTATMFARNSFFGYRAGFNITSGAGNTFVGAGAGNISVGSSNVAVGTAALGGYGSTLFSNNTAIGNQSGEALASGSANVFIGSRSGSFANGSTNTLIGFRTGSSSYPGNPLAIGSGNVLIGNEQGVSMALNNKLMIDNITTTTPLIWGDFAADQVKLNGKVGVGAVTTFPTLAGTVDVSNYKLFVTGGILTEEVRVNLRGVNGLWADYVFNKDYKLPTLQEVEKQIQEKGHLANMPSAKEVKENGIELGEMAKMQQEKIEELTLYIIEQNKINEKQNKKIADLEILVNKLINK